MKKSSYYQINSIVKAFRLIELLASRKEFELAEICRLLNIPKTTIHRILLTLESLGYVKQNRENLHYVASIKFFELGQRVVQKLNLIEIAHPHMIELSEKTGETINLGVLDSVDVVCIDKVESKQSLKQDQPIGHRHRAYSAGFGKAILAFLPKGERARLFSGHTIFRYTSKSLKTVAAIEKNLQKVREEGYSVDNEEGAVGVRCVGAPIFDHKGNVLAGISIAGPTLRIKEENIPHLAQFAIEAASSISELLGAHIGSSKWTAQDRVSQPKPGPDGFYTN